jgi:hypothetical protein
MAQSEELCGVPASFRHPPASVVSLHPSIIIATSRATVCIQMSDEVANYPCFRNVNQHLLK